MLGLPAWYGETGLFLTTHFFGMKINRYMALYDISQQTLAKVAAKNLRNGERNDSAWRRKPLSEETILAAPYLNYPLTQYMYCAPNEGAAAVVLCRRDLAPQYTNKPIHLAASVLRTRRYGAFELQSPSLPADSTSSPTVDASRAAFEKAGIGAEDVHVAQLQDTDAGSEIIHMAENGLCADGDQEKLISEGYTEITGKLPVNTDGGLIANGEPIGASGLRQIHEIVLQLRGRAGTRQIPGPHAVGYTHLYGAPGTGCGHHPHHLIRKGSPMGSTAVVTGGTGGLGSAVTQRLLDDGWRVVVPWIVESELARLPAHPQLELVEADLFDADGVAGVIDKAVSDPRAPLTAVANLVGGFAMGPRVHETPIDEFERLLRLNLRPTYLTTQAALPHLMKAGGGSIVAVSAKAAFAPFAGAASYLTAKAAVWALVNSLAVEYKADGIRVNAILPSVIDTPANREGQPEASRASWVSPASIADVIAFLFSDQAASITGAQIPVPGVG